MKVIARPIEMIWHTTEEGIITPLKFKIKEKDGKLGSYSVFRVWDTRYSRFAGHKTLEFTCEIEVNGKARDCEIRFDKMTCKWSLHKI